MSFRDWLHNRQNPLPFVFIIYDFIVRDLLNKKTIVTTMKKFSKGFQSSALLVKHPAETNRWDHNKDHLTRYIPLPKNRISDRSNKNQKIERFFPYKARQLAVKYDEAHNVCLLSNSPRNFQAYVKPTRTFSIDKLLEST